MNFKEYLSESIKDKKDKSMSLLFDGDVKKKELIKSVKFMNKLLTKFFMTKGEMDGEISLNSDAMRTILKSNGFDDSEIKELRKIVIMASKNVAKVLSKKYNIGFSEIPQNFGVYNLQITGDNTEKKEKEFGSMLKDEIQKKFNKLK